MLRGGSKARRFHWQCLSEFQDTDEVVGGIRGIGPWTRSIFRIFILREPDVLPQGDAALMKALQRLYGFQATLSDISERWRPFRSVACWYVWRSLGNLPLG